LKVYDFIFETLDFYFDKKSDLESLILDLREIYSAFFISRY